MALNEPNKTAVYLSDKEMEMFKWLWKNYDVWEKAKELKPGKLVLHFNSNNELRHKEFHYHESCG